MTETTERGDTIRIIRAELNRRTNRTWSVTGGRGTSWGWITVTAPPARRVEFGFIGADDAEVLAAALGFESVHCQGWSIPASRAHRIEAIDRARGLAAKPTPAYWD